MTKRREAQKKLSSWTAAERCDCGAKNPRHGWRDGFSVGCDGAEYVRIPGVANIHCPHCCPRLVEVAS